jgi:hypothetical protein
MMDVDPTLDNNLTNNEDDDDQIHIDPEHLERINSHLSLSLSRIDSRDSQHSRSSSIVAAGFGGHHQHTNAGGINDEDVGGFQQHSSLYRVSRRNRVNVSDMEIGLSLRSAM